MIILAIRRLKIDPWNLQGLPLASKIYATGIIFQHRNAHLLFIHRLGKFFGFTVKIYYRK